MTLSLRQNQALIRQLFVSFNACKSGLFYQPSATAKIGTDNPIMAQYKICLSVF